MLRFLLNASLPVKMLLILLLVAAFFLGTLLLVYLPAFERELLQDRKESLKNLVETVHSLLLNYHQRTLIGNLSLPEAQSRAILRVQQIRYGDQGYFWLNDTTLPFPRLILHPILSELEGEASDHERFRHARRMQFGTSGRTVDFPAGNKNLLQAFAEVANDSGDGYVTYSWPRPTPQGATEQYFPKECYVKLFAPWGWVIGTGAYIDDIQTRIARLRWNIFAVTGVILAIGMILLSSFIFVFVTRPVSALMHYAEAVSAGNRNLAASGRFWGEAGRLKTVLTRMVGDLDSAILQADSGRRVAQQEAEKAHLLTRRLNALFSSMTEIVVFHELVRNEEGTPVNYRFTDCNAAFEVAAGLRKEAIVGRLATELFHAETAPHLDVYARVAMGGSPVTFETNFVEWDRYFLVSVISPTPGEFVTISTDITARKHTEQLIAEKNKELEQIIYAASHDLRSPLVNIDGYGRELEFAVESLQSIQDGPGSSPDPSRQAFRIILSEMNSSLRHVRTSTRQMDALIKGLLSLSRSGRTEIHAGFVDMNALLAKVASTVDHLAKDRGARLVVESLPPCKADAAQLARVFSNLIGNALKFLDPQRPGLVTVTGSQEQGRSIYCVCDNGIGIAPEHQGKIFELFHRLNPSASEGEGLGLAIVRQILGRLDGKIWVDSTPGVGSRFFVSLPIPRPRPAASDAAAP